MKNCSREWRDLSDSTWSTKYPRHILHLLQLHMQSINENIDHVDLQYIGCLWHGKVLMISVDVSTQKLNNHLLMIENVNVISPAKYCWAYYYIIVNNASRSDPLEPFKGRSVHFNVMMRCYKVLHSWWEYDHHWY